MQRRLGYIEILEFGEEAAFNLFYSCRTLNGFLCVQI